MSWLPLELAAPAIPQARQSELASIVGQNLFDAERVKLQASLQKVRGSGFVFVLINPQKHQTGGTVNGHKTIAFFAGTAGTAGTAVLECG